MSAGSDRRSSHDQRSHNSGVNGTGSPGCGGIGTRVETICDTRSPRPCPCRRGDANGRGQFRWRTRDQIALVEDQVHVLDLAAERRRDLRDRGGPRCGRVDDPEAQVAVRRPRFSLVGPRLARSRPTILEDQRYRRHRRASRRMQAKRRWHRGSCPESARPRCGQNRQGRSIACSCRHSEAPRSRRSRGQRDVGQRGHSGAEFRRPFHAAAMARS